jgi:hypothetical protein
MGHVAEPQLAKALAGRGSVAASATATRRSALLRKEITMHLRVEAG